VTTPSPMMKEDKARAVGEREEAKPAAAAPAPAPAEGAAA